MKRITDANRGYATVGDRNRAVSALRRKGTVTYGTEVLPVNYFVFYRDTQAEIALQYGHAKWVKLGDISVQR